MFNRITFGCALVATTKAAVVTGSLTKATTIMGNLSHAVTDSAEAELYVSTYGSTAAETWLYPAAKASDGTTDPTATTNTFTWTLQNRSYIDEDTGYEYVEFTHELTAPTILETDVITFHLEFTTDDTTRVNLFRDGMECTLAKEATSSYWATTVKDLYVRDDPTTTDVTETADTAPTADDYNNSVRSGGQDWFVYEQDSVRGDTDHLCTASSDSSKACSSIKCISRRKMVTDDADDLKFDPSTADDTLDIPKYHSYILLNQSSVTNKQHMMNLIDSQIKIGKDAMHGAVVGAATIGAIAALALF